MQHFVKLISTDIYLVELFNATFCETYQYIYLVELLISTI